jgi:antitoxin Phd
VVTKQESEIEMSESNGRPDLSLHEAMAVVLNDAPNFTASTSFLSDEIWERQLYWQKEGGKALPDQIILRARDYPTVFEIIDRNTIRLLKTR